MTKNYLKATKNRCKVAKNVKPTVIVKNDSKIA